MAGGLGDFPVFSLPDLLVPPSLPLQGLEGQAMETIALAEDEVCQCIQQCRAAWLELEVQQLSRLQAASRAGSITPPPPPSSPGQGSTEDNRMPRDGVYGCGATPLTELRREVGTAEGPARLIYPKRPDPPPPRPGG